MEKIFSTLFLLLLLPLTSLGQPLMCSALFENRLPEILGTHYQTLEQLDSKLNDPAFLSAIQQTLSRTGITTQTTGSVITLLSDATDFLEKDSQFQNRSLSEKALIWDRISSQIQKQAQDFLPSTMTPSQKNTKYSAPLFLTLTALSFRFESALVRQHDLSPESAAAQDIFARFPALKEKYFQATTSITDPYPVHEQPVEHFQDIPTDSSHAHIGHPESAKSGLTSEVQSSILEIYNFLQDKNEFAEYSKNLLLESALQTKKNIDANSAEASQLKLMLSSGVIHPKIALKVLLRRLIHWDISVNIISEGFLSEDGFKEVLRTGSSILDFGILSMVPRHGYATHMLQHDYVMNRLSEKYGRTAAIAKWKELMKFLATDEGLGYWSDLFDSRIDEVLNNPTIFQHQTSRWIYFGTQFLSSDWNQFK